MGYKNKLKLNPNKRQGMQITFCKHPPTPTLSIGTTALKFVSSAKILGIHIQEDLKWDSQIDHVYKKASKRLYMIRNLKKFGFNKSELLPVYTGYVRPLLEYSDVIWHWEWPEEGLQNHYGS